MNLAPLKKSPAPASLVGLTQGLWIARVSDWAPCAAASFSASCSAGRAREIWLRRASLAFSKAGSWMGKAREAILIIGSTNSSVSTRYESCFGTEKALPMEEWLWKRSAALTRPLSQQRAISDLPVSSYEACSAIGSPTPSALIYNAGRCTLLEKLRLPNSDWKRMACTCRGMKIQT
jgi:hypothetical protein